MAMLPPEDTTDNQMNPNIMILYGSQSGVNKADTCRSSFMNSQVVLGSLQKMWRALSPDFISSFGLLIWMPMMW
jgi:hypothetical protein